MMDKKMGFPKRGFVNNSQPTEHEISTFKNENVLFKIHSARGQQSYNAKTFPAKFSINICNERSELGTGVYNRELTQPSFPLTIPSSNSKYQFQGMKTERASPSNFDLEQYDKQIKAVLEDKKKCDQLIRELQGTCEQYEYQNQELKNNLNQLNFKNQEYLDKLHQKDKAEMELKETLIRLKIQNKELEQKIRKLQDQLKRNQETISSRQNSRQTELQQLQNKIIELEEVIGQKEQMIKNISNFNNEITKKMLDEQLYSSSSHVKQMEKWLKLMSKKYESIKKDGEEQQKSNNVDPRNSNSYVGQLLNNCSRMASKIAQLEKAVYYLDHELKRTTKENQSLLLSNQELKSTINQLQSYCQQRQAIRDTQESFFKSSLRGQEGGNIIYQGTVKVKMENLLYEKDKRINSLQEELMEVKKENSMLRTKIYQLDCEQSYFKETMGNKQDANLKRARSLGSFYLQKQEKGKENGELNKIISQCNNLTQTLGSFMETCKTDRTSNLERRRSRFSQAFEANQDQNMDQVKELLELQKATYDILERNMKKQPISFQQMKWNQNRCDNLGRLEKQNSNTFTVLQSPATERISKYDYSMRRTDRSQKSCYFSQDR